MLYVKATNSPALSQAARERPPLRLRPTRTYLHRPRSSTLGLTPRADERVPGATSVDGTVPVIKPPYGTLTAIDLGRGEHALAGDGRRLAPHPQSSALQGPGPAPLGVAGSPGAMVTAGGLVFVTGGGSTLYAFDKITGQVLWQAHLGQRGYSVPMVYETASGRPFVVVATGGGPGASLQAFTLTGSR